MNIEEYISSGILEMYAMGQCTPAEQQEVEAMVKLYPEIAKELAEIEAALEQFSQSQSIAPPAHLKAQILDKIAPKSHLNIKYKVSLYAAAAMLLVSLGLNIVLYQKTLESQEKLQVLQQEKTLLSEKVSNQETRLNETANQLALINRDDLEKINLQSTQILPDVKVQMLWSKQNRELFVNTQNLPQAPAGKQYQVWAIIDGKPVSAGLIPLNHKPYFVYAITGFAQAQMFAITIEPVGGLPAPTLSQMIAAAPIKS